MRVGPTVCCMRLTRAVRQSLLIGGDKTGNVRWYETYVPLADRLYDTPLETLNKEGQING